MRARFIQTFSPFRSLRARFAVAMGVFGITLGMVMTGLIEWRLEEGLSASARDSLQSTASEIAHTLSDSLETRQHEVALIGSLVGLSQLKEFNALQEVLDGLKQRQPTYAWIGLTKPDGVVFAATDGLLKGVDVSERPWFIQGVQGPFLGDPHDAKLLAKYMRPGADGGLSRFLDVAVPVRNHSGHTIGVLGAHLYWDWVHEVVLSSLAHRLQKTPVEVLIANQRGDWLLSPHTETSKNLTEWRQTVDDDRFLSVVQTTSTPTSPSDLKWTVVVREKTTDALSPIDENRRLMLLLTALLGSAFGVGTWLIAGRVVRPIVDLADAAKNHTSFSGHRTDLAAAKLHDETMLVGQALDRLARFDPLTGLVNRRVLKERLEAAMHPNMAHQSSSAVLLVNMDNFSVLNNTQGHEVGDQLLQAVAQRLLPLVRANDTLARVGGDEFVLVLTGLDPSPVVAMHEASAIASTVSQSFKAPFELAHGPCQCDASIGMTMLQTTAQGKVDDVLKQVELAVLEAKQSGKNQTVVYDQQMQERLLAQVAFEQALRDAVPDQLLVYCQAQVDAQAHVTGAELLVRWQHPTHGMVSPAKFIPVAEHNGLIVTIGYWMLSSACRQIKAWEADPIKCEWVLSVNVSAKELGQPDYVATVQEILAGTGANPQRLKLELTESTLASDMQGVVAKMHQLKAMGVSFALDDFGTGFSSLSYLQQMPIDQLKIDQSFVRDLGLNGSDSSIVRTVIALGQSLGLSVIAEGVETAAQRDLLAQLGCHHYQGYFYGKPAPLAEFVQGLG